MPSGGVPEDDEFKYDRPMRSQILVDQEVPHRSLRGEGRAGDDDQVLPLILFGSSGGEVISAPDGRPNRTRWDSDPLFASYFII